MHVELDQPGCLCPQSAPEERQSETLRLIHILVHAELNTGQLSHFTSSGSQLTQSQSWLSGYSIFIWFVVAQELKMYNDITIGALDMFSREAYACLACLPATKVIGTHHNSTRQHYYFCFSIHQQRPPMQRQQLERIIILYGNKLKDIILCSQCVPLQREQKMESSLMLQSSEKNYPCHLELTFGAMGNVTIKCNTCTVPCSLVTCLHIYIRLQ